MELGDDGVTDNWPEEGLERLGACPICGSSQRSILHEDLTDRAFRVAPGYWNLFCCNGCGAGYLDPRPTRETIGRAYSTYYTHRSDDSPTIRRIGVLRTVLHDWLNGYMNWRYGLRLHPAWRLGVVMIPLMWPLRAAADAECRHLPRPPEEGGALLDIGCGNGRFLRLAQAMGWNVEGVDPDPQAVLAAQKNGLCVRRGGIELLDGMEERYDVITLSHVIEHVHDPLALLARIHRLLKPGGMLWLETPNLASLGHKRYGGYWRGLEPPRHLVLFAPRSLRRALRQTGFGQISTRFRGFVLYSIFAASEAIQRNEDVARASRGGRPLISDLLAEVKEAVIPGCREFLTVVAKKGR